MAEQPHLGMSEYSRRAVDRPVWSVAPERRSKTVGPLAFGADRLADSNRAPRGKSGYSLQWSQEAVDHPRGAKNSRASSGIRTILILYSDSAQPYSFSGVP